MAPDEDQSMAMSKILDESDIRGDNGEFSRLLDDSVLERSAANEESKRGGRKPKREKNTIDFQQSICFYEDSEGDFNVMSEDEDLADAQTYFLQHNAKALKCSIVPKTFYEDMRAE